MKRWKQEDGAVAIIVAFSLTLLITCCALVFDLGGAYLSTAKLQTAADAAVFSAGSLLPVKPTDTGKINEITQLAKHYAQQNGVQNAADVKVTLSGFSRGHYRALTVEIQEVHQMNLAKVIGKDTVALKKEATVSVMPVSGLKGVTPIGISVYELMYAKGIGQTNNIVLKYGGGSGTNGVFGFIVLDGSNGNANILLDWMKHGYDETLQVGHVLPYASGNKASAAKQGIDYRLSLCTHYPEYGGCSVEHYVTSCPKIIKALVYTPMDSDNVQIIGFAPFLIESVDNQANIYGSYLDITMDAEAGSNSVLDAGLQTMKLIK